MVAVAHRAPPEYRGRGVLDAAHVRAPGGNWKPSKDGGAAGVLLRGAVSVREHHASCANAIFFHERSDYCVRPTRKGALKDQTVGARMECRMGAGAILPAGAPATWLPYRLTRAGAISWISCGTSGGCRIIPPSIPSGGRPMET